MDTIEDISFSCKIRLKFWYQKSVLGSLNAGMRQSDICLENIASVRREILQTKILSKFSKYC